MSRKDRERSELELKDMEQIANDHRDRADRNAARVVELEKEIVEWNEAQNILFASRDLTQIAMKKVIDERDAIRFRNAVLESELEDCYKKMADIGLGIRLCGFVGRILSYLG